MNQVRGTIHGKTIELYHETGLPDGQEVAVVVVPLMGAGSDEPLPPGEGLRQAFGAWAEDAEELDKFLEWNQRQRELSRLEVEP